MSQWQHHGAAGSGEWTYTVPPHQPTYYWPVTPPVVYAIEFESDGQVFRVEAPTLDAVLKLFEALDEKREHK